MAIVSSIVEVEFTPGSGVWTDISQYVEGYDFGRGRSYEFDEIEVGTGSLVLNNADGRFTPDRTASPYYPNIKPRRRVRITATVNGNSYGIFAGWVERWPMVATQGSSTVTATLTESLGAMARRRFTRPYFHELVLGTGPWRYGPFNDAAGPLADVPNVDLPFAVTGPVAVGGAGLLASGELDQGGSVSNSSALVNDGVSPAFRAMPGKISALYGSGYVNPFSGRRPWGAFGIFQITKGTLEGSYWRVPLFEIKTATGTVILQAVATISSPSGNVTVTVTSPSLTAGTYNVGFAPGTFDNPTPLFIGYDSTNIYVRAGNIGVSTSATVSLGVTTYTPSEFNILYSDPANVASGFTASVSNFAFWGIDQGTGPPAIVLDGTLNAAAVRFIAGDDSVSAGSLMRELCAISGMIDGVAEDATMVSMPEPALGDSVIEIGQQVALSCDGLMYSSFVGGGTNTLFYKPRTARYSPPSGGTFKDSTGSSPEPGLTFEVDEARIVNAVTLTRVGADDTTARDQSSIAEFGQIDESYDSWLTDDGVAQGAAEWRVYLKSDARLRCDVAEFDVTSSAVSSLGFLQLELGAEITLDELPSVAPATTLKFFVEGISYKCEKSGETEEITATLQLSPSLAWKVWTLQGSGSSGQIDNAGFVLAY